MASDEVLYEENDGIAIITINRPEKKNTLTDAVIQGVADGVDAAAKSKDVAAIVIRGEGGTLTAGYDLTPDTGDIEAGWSTPYGAKGPEPRDGAWDPVRDYQFMGNNVRRFMKIWECPKPVIGQIEVAHHPDAGGLAQLAHENRHGCRRVSREVSVAERCGDGATVDIDAVDARLDVESE